MDILCYHGDPYPQKNQQHILYMIQRNFREVQLCEQANVTDSFGIRNIYDISHK
jgi:hypothetical protein